MIADLRVKGRDSAGKLRKALYSMFDLDLLEAAINHIGRNDLKTTVLGKLFLSKGTISSGSEIAAVKTNIENAQARIEKYEEAISAAKEKMQERKDFSQRVSEQIGSSKSKADYERQRKALKGQRDTFLKNAEMQQGSFGDAVMDMFPHLLISKAVTDASNKIHLKIQQNKLPTGVTKSLVQYLLSEKTTECVCGAPLCEAQKKHIQQYLDMLPPRSFTMLYQEFIRTAKTWGKGYDKATIESFIKSVLDNQEQAEQCDTQIRELDEREKKSPDIENLIIDRQKAEEEIKELDEKIRHDEIEKKKYEIYLSQQMKQFESLTQATAASKIINHQMQIMEQVLAHFKNRLESESLTYSQRLEDNIQSLINQMLTSKRTVRVSQEFSVQVTDSFGDESKSEGQFAVVSFAYIGGILQMLRTEEHLASKEYPLVLDGPFSKLDPDQRQNVVNMIPEFAPQVILFSKDDLQNVFASEHIGRVWTIQSNEEKNIANVQEGYLWN